MTTGLLTVTGSLLSTLAIGFTLVFIDPLFALLAVVAGVPVTLSNLRVGRALYHFDVEQTPTDRERNYVENLLVGKDAAKDLRAYNLTEYLKARFDSLYERRISALRTLIRKRSVQGVVGGFLTAVISGGVLGLLIVFVSDGRTSLAGAGAAAAALILLGGQIQGLASGVGNLFESALFIQDFNEFVEIVPRGAQFTGKTTPAIENGQLSVRDLSFTYPSRSEPRALLNKSDDQPGPSDRAVEKTAQARRPWPNCWQVFTDPTRELSPGTESTWLIWTFWKSARG